MFTTVLRRLGRPAKFSGNRFRVFKPCLSGGCARTASPKKFCSRRRFRHAAALSAAVLLLTISGPSVSEQDDAEAWQFFAEFGYDSRYIGGVARENTLDHGGYYTTTLGAGRGGFTLEYWEAYGAQVHYRETNFAVSYALDITDKLSAEAGYVHLDFEESELDTETFLTLDYRRHAWVPSVTYTYSSQANGGFLTLAWGTEFEAVYTGTLELRGEFGMDYGYFSESYDGPNHLLFGAVWTKPLTPNWSVNIRADQVVALENLHREAGTHLTTVGVGIAAGF